MKYPPDSCLKRLLMLTIILLLAGVTAPAQGWMNRMYGPEGDPGSKNLNEIRKEAEEHFKYARMEYFSRYFRLDDNPELRYGNLRDYIAYKRWEEYWLNHVDNQGFPVSPITEYNRFQAFLKGSNTKGPAANWTNINRTEAPGGYWGMGRIREIAFHPSDPSTIWLGADQGGIWKSSDNGSTYTPVGDGLPFLRVSSICVDPGNPDIIYMAGGGIGTNYWQRAIGVYKTTDGGSTWEPTGFTSFLWENKYIRRLAMNPVNPAMLLVTTHDGTYRTTDSGENWELVYSGEAWDILFHPDGERVLIGRGPSILYSENDGDTWQAAVTASESGIFKHLAVSPLDPKFMAGQVEGNDITTVYVSDDGGVTWEKRSTVNDTGGTIGFSAVDTTTLYRGWTKIYRSENFGSDWQQITNWYYVPGVPEVHADHFRIEMNPHTPGTLYFCNDGGLYIYDEVNDIWTERSAGLIISQYYSLSSSQTDPQVLLCGSQDNGGWYRQSSGYWRTTNGGDGMHTWQDPVNNNYGYSSYPGGKIYRTNTGWAIYSSLFDNIYPVPDDGDWNSRFAVDPNNKSRLVTGCFKDVYESKNQGESWTKISNNLTGGRNLHTITIPEANSDIIYTSAGGSFYYSLNRGINWKSSSIPGSNTISEIVASDFDPSLVWVTTGGFSDGYKVFESRDYGKTWTNISGSLPNIPALSIVHQKGTRGTLYIGMTYGIYYRNADMADWEFYGHGIPNTEIRDLDIYYPDNKIRCATYGRGLYEADLVPISGDMPQVDFSASRTEVCFGESVTFTNLTTGAESFVWNFGDGERTPVPSPDHTYAEPGSYSVTLTAFSENFASSLTNEAMINVKPYLAAIRLGPKTREMGPGNFSRGGSGGALFNVHFRSKLLSVRVYAANGGRRTIDITDSSGVLMKRVTQNLVQGENTILIDCDLPPGNDYSLTATDTDGLYFNYSGAEYPYGKDKLVSITGNTDLNSSRYLYFYDWTVQYMTCNSSDLPPLDGDANITAQEITIYPNPVDDWFRIVVKGFEPEELLRLRILKMDGTVVYSREMGLERELDLSILSLQNSAGTLLVEISGESHKSTSRLVRIGK